MTRLSTAVGDQSARAALDAYADLAPRYDEYTRDDNYEVWGRYLKQLITAWHPTASRVLDVACGTGRSTAALRAQGFCVTGCDLSEPMLAQARSKFPDVEFFQADMRDLTGVTERYDVVNCMDDALNFLLSDEDLGRAFHSAAAVLESDGLYVADTNTLHAYRTSYAEDAVTDRGDVLFAWQGLTAPDAEPGCQASAHLTVFVRGSAHAWIRQSSPHLQRHHPPARVEALLQAAGLELVATAGLLHGELTDPSDDLRDVKTIYVARKMSPRGEARRRPGPLSSTTSDE